MEFLALCVSYVSENDEDGIVSTQSIYESFDPCSSTSDKVEYPSIKPKRSRTSVYLNYLQLPA